jgi:hypothetical protein
MRRQGFVIGDPWLGERIDVPAAQEEKEEDCSNVSFKVKHGCKKS